MEGGAGDAKGYCDGPINYCMGSSAPDCKLKVKMGCNWMEGAKGYCDGADAPYCQAIVSAPDCKLKVNMGCKWYGEGDGKGEGRLPQNKTMHHPTESTLPR